MSILVVNWNTTHLLPRCLRAALNSAEGLKAEAIVVDNASKEPPRSEELGEKVKLMVNPKNLGYSKGVNQAAREAEGEFLMLLNPDARPREGAIRKLVEFARLHPRAGAVAPILVNPDGTIQASVRKFPTPFSLLLWGTKLTKWFPHLARRWPYVERVSASAPRQVDQPMASALLVRKRAWEEVGGMDERFFLYFSDVDLCLRLKRKGWQIWLFPEAVVEHDYGASTNLARWRAILHSHWGAVLFFAKYHRNLAGILASAVLLFTLPFRLLLSRVARPP